MGTQTYLFEDDALGFVGQLLARRVPERLELGRRTEQVRVRQASHDVRVLLHYGYAIWNGKDIGNQSAFTPITKTTKLWLKKVPDCLRNCWLFPANDQRSLVIPGLLLWVLNPDWNYSNLKSTSNRFSSRLSSFVMLRKRKRHHFKIGSERIRFNVHFEQRQRSKKTRMYPSRMHTGRLLTDVVGGFLHGTPPAKGDIPLLRMVPLLRMAPSAKDGTPPAKDDTPLQRMTSLLRMEPPCGRKPPCG